MTSSGKKLFALIAVALMVVSCLAAVATVDDSKADTSNVNPIVINNSGQKWVLDETSSTVTGITIDDRILTLDNVTASFSTNFIKFTVDNYDLLTIKVKGNNNITSTFAEGGFINCSQHGLKIIGDSRKDDTLTITFNKIESGFFGIAVSASSFVLENVNFSVVFSKDCTDSCYGVEIGGNVEISGADVKMTYSQCKRIFGIICNDHDVTIKQSSSVTINLDHSVASVSNYGITAKNLNINESTVSIGSCSGTPGQSVGILLRSGVSTIINSNVETSGLNEALCNREDESGYSAASTSNYRDVTIKGSTDALNPTYTDDIKIGDPIDLKYKSIKIEGTKRTASFDPNGGTGTTDPISKGVGEKYNMPKCGFTKSGFSFGGWSIDGSNIIYDGTEMTMGETNVTYKAMWNKVSENMEVQTDSEGKALIVVDDSIKTIKVRGDDMTLFVDQPTVQQKLKNHTFYVQVRESNGDDVYEIVAMIDGQEQKVAFKGDMLITLPFDSSKGAPSAYIREGSTDTPLEITKDSGTLSFTVDHSCKCVIKYTATPGPAENDHIWLLVVIIAIFVIEILALVAYIRYTQNKS